MEILGSEAVYLVYMLATPRVARSTPIGRHLRHTPCVRAVRPAMVMPIDFDFWVKLMDLRPKRGQNGLFDLLGLS